MAILSNTGIRAGASGVSSGYQIEKSLRFNSDDTAYLNRTQVAGNRKTYTISWWQKFGKTRSNQRVFGTSASYQHSMMFDGSDRFYLYYQSSNGNGEFTTANSFRDPTGWYHFVFAVDTTQATASNRMKLWVNGVQQTDLVSTTYPNQNVDMYWNYATPTYIGKYQSGYHFEGYLAEIFMTDGTAYDASTFGEENANGKWVPKDCSESLSYGNNGCYLKFNGTDLGEDSSGENHDWTANNFSLEDGAAVTVASATGAKPIWNTSDDHGQTIGSGVRTDSNSSDLAGAWPLTAANSNALTDDESGNSRTLTAYGSSSSDTNKYRYYGSSCSFAANGYFGVSNSDFTFGTDDFTIECWIYHPNNNTINGTLFSTHTNSLTATTFNSRMYGASNLDIYTSGSSEYITISNPPRDEWFHLAMVRSGSTMKVYFNGKLKVTNNYWSMNLATGQSGNLYINKGRDGSCARWMQDVRVYTTAKYSGEFTPPQKSVNNITAGGLDVLKDTPTDFDDDGTGTGNYCTLNPFDNSTNSLLTLSNGNLSTSGAASNYAQVRATMEMASGKWYWEVTRVTGLGAADPRAGVCGNDVNMTGTRGGTESNSWAYLMTDTSPYGGKAFNSGTYSGSEDLFSNGDVAMFAYDADAGKLWFGKNGTWIGSGNPAAGSNEVYSNVTAPVIPFIDSYYATTNINFGQRAFTYTPPTGFKTLNTYNLPDPAIASGKDYFDVVSYTGSGWSSTTNPSQSITGLSFSPDLVWAKSNSSSYSHCTFDTVGGAQKFLRPDGSNAYTTTTAGTNDSSLISFDSGGFTLGPDGGAGTINYGGGTTYIAHTWDAGSTTTTNDASSTGIGTIDSTYRVNTTAGFSIVSYTGTEANATVAHGLNAKPELILIKTTGATNNWMVLHSYNYARFLSLDINNGSLLGYGPGSYAAWNGDPTSSVFTLGTYSKSNDNGENHIAYCWSGVAGYSKFNTYKGNGYARGPFVHLGFKPSFVMVKHTTSSQNWIMWSQALKSDQGIGYMLAADVNTAQQNFADVEFCSNGFSVKSTHASVNTNNGIYLYAAWAESPFKYANAR